MLFVRRVGGIESQGRVSGDEEKVSVIVQECAVVEDGAGRNDTIHHWDPKALALKLPAQHAGRCEDWVGYV